MERLSYTTTDGNWHRTNPSEISPKPGPGPSVLRPLQRATTVSVWLGSHWLGQRNLSSLTRDQTQAPCTGSVESATGPPGATSFCDSCTDLPRMLPHSFVCFFQTLNVLFCTGVQPIDWVQFLGWEDPMEKGMATQSSILPWRITRMKEPAGAILHRVAKSQAWLSD